MLKIKNTLSFAALVCGLLICFNAPAAVQGVMVTAHAPDAAQNFVPPGSYQSSCAGIKTVGADLSANCGSAGGGLSIGGSLTDYFECEGDIANIKSKLECNRNPNSPLMVKAKAAVDDQYTAVTGSKIGYGVYESHIYFLRLMFADGMAPQFYKGRYGQLDVNLRTFIQNWLNKPENISRKAEVVERAFKDVYNYGANPKDLAFYNTQNIGYTDVVIAETAKLNSKPFVRRVMINAAYKKTMGRPPTAGDYAYWEPRTEYFTQIVDAARAYLYTPNGAGDLAETVKRALNNNMSGEVTSAHIKSAIVKYTPNKTIFDEM
ncbi:MAG: hypothetical protein WKF90_12905 [Pyrinomonadaceae bacterium]